MSNLNIKAGTGVTFSYATGNMTIACTGGSFGAIQTYTPVLSIGGSTTGITYTAQLGDYIINGGVCTVVASINLLSKGVQSGNVALTLPVAISGSISNAPKAAILANGLVALTGTVWGTTAASSTALNLIIANGVTSGSLTDTSLTNSTTFNWNFSYFV